MPEIKTSCPYCGVGCGMIAGSDGSRITSVRGDPDHPSNFGKLCQKGATVAHTLAGPTRLKYAMVRRTKGDAPLLAVSPSRAIAEAVKGLDRVIQKYGPQAIGIYLSGQLTTESQYVFNKFGKGCLRTNHVDSNSRLCMSSAASAMALSLGSDGPPTCYDDIEQADTFLFVGSNAAACHPITFGRVQRRIETARAQCVVVDPRKTATADAASLHLAVNPGTDLALLNGLLYLLRAAGKLDYAFIAGHTEGWAEVDATIDEYPPDVVSRLCGIPAYRLAHAARLLAGARRLITFWTMGVNQSLGATFTGNAIINLHLATGQIGRPGCGPFSLTGQPNAMGGRDVGYMSHLLPGQRQINNPEHRSQIEAVWGLRPGTIYPHAGYDAVSMFDALATGELRAIWIAGSNPAASMPNLPQVRKGLARADLVIVQDAYYPTETTRYAHVAFPAAVNLEQAGTFCNSERRVTLMNAVVPPPGDARPDWWWPRQVAEGLGLKSGMGFSSAEQIFDEFARSTAGRPNDQSGLSHALLREGPRQWPFPAAGATSPRRYEDGLFSTPSGRARFWARRHAPAEEQPDARFPLVLNTGRVAGQWHTRTKSGLVRALNKLDPSPFLQMHPADAAELGLRDGQRVDVESRRGVAWSVLRIEERIARGSVFMPMHWNDLWAEGASCNEATTDAADPISKQPMLKQCAVAVRARCGTPLRVLAAVAADRPDSARASSNES